MALGNKPAGYIVTNDREGRKIERELRQCAHCQHTWIYQPGSGIKRGLCLSCGGLLCCRESCLPPFQCAPFRDIALARDPRYRLTAGGLYMKGD